MPNEHSDCLCDKLVRKGKFIKYEMLLANRKTTCIMLVIMKTARKKSQVDFHAGQVRFNGQGYWASHPIPKSLAMMSKKWSQTSKM